MKTIFLSLALLTASTLAFANSEGFGTGVKSFPITQAHLAPVHFDQSFESGNLNIDYDQKMVTLTLNRSMQCPAGQICIQMMPAPLVVRLPIVSVEAGECGALKVLARKNLMTRDGVMEQISIVDDTSLICRIMLPYQGTATYTTSSLAQQSQDVNIYTSKMILGGHTKDLDF
jgi:hypothetical protein